MGKGPTGLVRDTRQRALHEERAAAFRDFLHGVNLEPLVASLAVRNALEHLDERVDRVGLAILDAPAGSHHAVMLDVVLNRESVITETLPEASQHLFRVFLPGGAALFVVDDACVSVRALTVVAEAIVTRCVELAPDLADSNGDGLILFPSIDKA